MEYTVAKITGFDYSKGTETAECYVVQAKTISEAKETFTSAYMDRLRAGYSIQFVGEGPTFDLVSEYVESFVDGAHSNYYPKLAELRRTTATGWSPVDAEYFDYMQEWAYVRLHPITDPDKLVNCVTADYRYNSVEFSEGYLENIKISMPKKDFLEAYAEIQYQVNGDEVVRLNKNGSTYATVEELIPEGWGSDMVCGDADRILSDINAERKNGGPIFARLVDNPEGEVDNLEESDLLDLIFGDFEEGPFLVAPCEDEPEVE